MLDQYDVGQRALMVGDAVQQVRSHGLSIRLSGVLYVVQIRHDGVELSWMRGGTSLVGSQGRVRVFFPQDLRRVFS